MEAERRSEGTNDVDERIHIFDGVEKPRTDFGCVGGLAEMDVNVGDAVLLEKG
jgi:hypothetical protein